MDFFDGLTLAGGLSLFLFGMSVMSQALERRAGGGLRSLLKRLTSHRLAGLLTGLGITAVIQSSSATTVMVVGFVNSGLMTLSQAINVIMGANIGTTVTAWILSLAGLDGSSFLVRLLKPSSFAPVLALAGIILYMFCKNPRKKDTGAIFLGFAILMFGMETMSSAVAGLRDAPWFQDLFLLFENPLLGVLAGAALTAIIQSSSASVGILQALAATGRVTYAAAIPIVMGQNIGTCVTAILSAVGTGKNAKRAALAHLSFNVIGTAVWLTVFSLVRGLFHPALLAESASPLGIAAIHSIFNILCTILMLPLSGLLEKLVKRLVPDTPGPETAPALDERLLATPPIALDRCRKVAAEMAADAADALREALDALENDTPALEADIREKEERTDRYEDILSSYLVKLSAKPISGEDSAQAAKLLKTIGDFERIADHAVNILRSAWEMREKEITFTPAASSELAVIARAVREALDLALTAFLRDDLAAAASVEPLKQVIEQLKEQLRTRHILRMQRGLCSIDAGFVWADLLTDLERTGGHCSNIAGCVLEMAERRELNVHESLREMRLDSEDFRRKFRAYRGKYTLANIA